MVTCDYFTAEDINDIVKRFTQAEIQKEINLAKYELSNGTLPDMMIPYWEDRRDAHQLALDVSSSITGDLIAQYELISVKVQNEQLREKLYSKPEPKPYTSKRSKYRNVL